MRRERVRKAYRELAPEELFRLALAADARGDVAEREAIVSSCPKMRVRTIHPAFEAALEGAWALLDVAVLSLARYLGRLEMLEALKAPIQEAVACLVRAPVQGPDEPGPFVCQEVARTDALRFLGGVMAAFTEACQEHGLEAGDVLRVFAPGMFEALSRYEEAIREAGPHPEVQEAFRSDLASAWKATVW